MRRLFVYTERLGIYFFRSRSFSGASTKLAEFAWQSHDSPCRCSPFCRALYIYRKGKTSFEIPSPIPEPSKCSRTPKPLAKSGASRGDARYLPSMSCDLRLKRRVGQTLRTNRAMSSHRSVTRIRRSSSAHVIQT